MWTTALKAISWRLVATCTTAAIAFAATSDMTLSLSIGGSEAILKIFLFMIHERAWARLQTPVPSEVNSNGSIDSVTP